jgi:hypothetical protein
MCRFTYFIMYPNYFKMSKTSYIHERREYILICMFMLMIDEEYSEF